ncbi:hypothetical protein XA68_14154 [Ophiocordyceps unilateralis]|uniref:High-temperature-induced dauer-formation protein n=1 Tax=Ophiocordyceps unilateralis TaxID=268505 RepID=A0A2A9P9A5_OPHUN|nr:hypothetical protein XA68_14154 [Ophiocordyceps unilateralis]
MGASDSKIVFKQGIFRLSEERHIPADDTYWTSFWELPESAEDVFSLFSPADIRRTRDRALENIETLVLALTSRLFILRHHPSFPDPELAPERDALNCVRILTRIMPYIYEKESLKTWEERFFWGARRKKSRRAAIANEVLFDEAQDGKQDAPAENDEFVDVKPLAEELVDTLIDLLFFSDLTIPRQPHGQSKVTYAIWQSGVGCNTAVSTTKEFENNRNSPAEGGADINLSLYLPRQAGRTIGLVFAVEYDTQVQPSKLASPVQHAGIQGPEADTEHAPAQKNFYRHFLGRLHRPQDFQFIVDGISRILSQPLQDKTSYLPGPQTSGNLTPEMLMLFWELTQCNKRFRSFIIDTDRAHDFVVLTLFHALEYKSDPAKQGVVRMCAFLLQTLSVETNFGHNLNKRFEGQESLPACIRINGFNGSYTDFLIHSIYCLITSSQGSFAAVYPALLAVINNIAPHVEGLSAAGSSQLMHLFSSMSSPAFLLANETNHTLLDSLLESINSIIENKYRQNPELMLAIVKSRKRIEALRSFTLESGQEELERRSRRRKDVAGNGDNADSGSVRSSLDSARSPPPVPSRMPTLGQVPEDSAFAIGDNEEDDSDDEPQATPAPSTTSENQSQASSAVNIDDAVPVQLRGMSEKARGKMPAAIRSFSRQNSTTSLGSQPTSGRSQGGGFEPTAQWIDSWLPELPLHSILTVIQQVTSLVPGREAVSMDAIRRVQEMGLVGVEPSPPHVHSFEWSQPALAWYESLLWGMIFTSEMQIAKGTMGMWNGTSIKLFRVQETAPEGPTLTSPRGAVDAVGSNIVSRIGQINLRGGPAQTGGSSSSRAGA